jgi:hypothetical protein
MSGRGCAPHRGAPAFRRFDRGSRQGFDPLTQLQAMLPGTWTAHDPEKWKPVFRKIMRGLKAKRALPAPSCPSPVTAPHASAVVPKGLMPEAAPARLRARAEAPHSPHTTDRIRNASLIERDSSQKVAEMGTNVKICPEKGDVCLRWSPPVAQAARKRAVPIALNAEPVRLARRPRCAPEVRIPGVTDVRLPWNLVPGERFSAEGLSTCFGRSSNARALCSARF